MNNNNGDECGWAVMRWVCGKTLWIFLQCGMMSIEMNSSQFIDRISPRFVRLSLEMGTSLCRRGRNFKKLFATFITFICRALWGLVHDKTTGCVVTGLLA